MLGVVDASEVDKSMISHAREPMQQKKTRKWIISSRKADKMQCMNANNIKKAYP